MPGTEDNCEKFVTSPERGGVSRKSSMSLASFCNCDLAHGDAGARQRIAQTLGQRLLAGVVEIQLAGGLPELGIQNILHVLAVDVQLALFLRFGADLDLVFRAAAGEILHAHFALDLLRLRHGGADLVERRRDRRT